MEGTYRISETLGVRVPAGFLSADLGDTDGDIDYDADVELGGIGLLGDYLTGMGGLRLSAGAIWSRYAIDGRGRGDGTVGATDYTGVDLRVKGRTRNDLLPIASVGYDGRIGPRLTLSADVGAMYTGGYDIRLSDASGQVSQEDIDAEIDDIGDDLPDVLPYVKFTVAFRF